MAAVNKNNNPTSDQELTEVQGPTHTPQVQETRAASLRILTLYPRQNQQTISRRDVRGEKRNRRIE